MGLLSVKCVAGAAKAIVCEGSRARGRNSIVVPFGGYQQ